MKTLGVSGVQSFAQDLFGLLEKISHTAIATTRIKIN
jgi:hypothetical protein